MPIPKTNLYALPRGAEGLFWPTGGRAVRQAHGDRTSSRAVFDEAAFGSQMQGQ